LPSRAEELAQLHAIVGVDATVGSVRAQFYRLREDLVISDGVEAWQLTPAGWQQIDATMAFLNADWLTPARPADCSAKTFRLYHRGRSRDAS
jgi:hypothetical protein